jgi:hypothetical protein
MSTPAAVVLISLLIAFGVGLAIVMLLQEVRARAVDEPPTYVIEDAVAFAKARLEPDVLTRVRYAGVQRIIEWSVHYLQGLAEKAVRRNELVVVAGGEGNAIEYITGELAKKGHSYLATDVEAVLVTEGEYLASIGALGAVADESELA